MRKAKVYICMSLDGFIAGADGDMSFLALAEGGGDYGYADFVDTVDTVIMGRITYEWVMNQVDEFPHADKQTYILTRTPRPASGKISFWDGDPLALLARLKAQPGKTIFIDGGAKTVEVLAPLVDEYIITVMPVLLGSGVRLFDATPYTPLKLLNSRSFETGLVQLHYVKN